jgi:hypothetical protein
MFSDASWISDPDALLQQVLDIQENAQYCEAFKRPEACWGDDVVRPILSLTHKVAGLGKDVRVDNVYALSILSIHATHSCRTSTRIWPASHSPSIPKKSTTVSSSHPLPNAKLVPKPNLTLCPTRPRTSTRPAVLSMQHLSYFFLSRSKLPFQSTTPCCSS